MTSSRATGTLNVTSDGVIDDGGVIEASGTTILNSSDGLGSTYDIVLDGNHDFFTVGIQSGNNVVLNDNNDGIVFYTSTVKGNLTVTAAAETSDSDLLDGISQVGILNVDGNTLLSADDLIKLDNSNNLFNTVSIVTAREATLRDANALELGSIAITGDDSTRRFNVVAESISQSVCAKIESRNGGEISLDATTILSVSDISTQGSDGQISSG